MSTPVASKLGGLDARLDPLVDAVDFNDALRGVAKQLAASHSALPIDTAGSGTSTAAWRSRWRDAIARAERALTFSDRATDAEDLREVTWLSEQYLHHREDLFGHRARDGHVRIDPGGDATGGGPARRDVLEDVAALAAEVEVIAGPRAAQRLLAWYREFANEHHPTSLAHLFMAFHALDRGWVDMARQHLEQARPRLVMIGGGPGTGKTLLATVVSEVLGWPVLGDAATSELLEHAETLLHLGEAMIVEASWADGADREAARRLAGRCAAGVIEIECHLNPAVARERLAWQLAWPWNDDQSLEIIDPMGARHDAWPEATRIDTAMPLLRCRADALKAILGFAPQPASRASVS